MNPQDSTLQPMQPSQSYHFGRGRLQYSEPSTPNPANPSPEEPQAEAATTPVAPTLSQPTRHMEPQQAASDDSLAAALEAARKRIEELHGTPEPPQHSPGTLVSPHGSIQPVQQPQPAQPAAAAPVTPVQPQPALAAAAPMYDPLRTTSALHNPSLAKPQATAQPKAAKPKSSRLKPILTGIGAMALILVIFKAQILLSQIGYLTGNKAPAPAATPAVATVSAASVISIPKINVNAPVVYEPSIVEANVQKSLESGVVHYGNTPSPGQAGNSVFVGHSSNDWWEPGNYKFVFVLLDKMVVGDTFNINYQGQKYVYQVTEVKVVEPTDLSVLAPTSDPTVTLITCTPPGTSWKRLIVKAKQISPSGTVKPTAASQSASATPALPGSSTGFLDQVKGAWQGFVAIFSGHSSTTDTPSPTVPAASSLPSAS